MNKKRVVLYIFLTFALLCTSVYATISGDISLLTSKNTIQAGEELDVTLKITDVTLNAGIDSIEGYINIDENVLEDLTLESIVTENGKVVIGDNTLSVYNSNTNVALPTKGVFFNDNPVSGKGDYRLVISLTNAVPNNTELVTLKFKVKDGIEEGTYQNAISYDLFVLFNEEVDKTEKISKSLDVVVEAEEKDEVNENETNNTVNNTVDNTTNNTVKNEIKNEVKNNTVNNTTNNTVKNTVNNTTNNTVKNTVNNTVKNTVKNTVNNTVKNSIKNTSKNNVISVNKDNTVSTNRLPDTGYRIIIVPIVVVAVLGLVFYSKYNKYNNI